MLVEAFELELTLQSTPAREGEDLEEQGAALIMEQMVGMVALQRRLLLLELQFFMLEEEADQLMQVERRELEAIALVAMGE